MPDPTATAGKFPQNFLEKTFSNLSTSGPWPIHLEDKTFLIDLKEFFEIYG